MNLGDVDRHSQTKVRQDGPGYAEIAGHDGPRLSGQASRQRSSVELPMARFSGRDDWVLCQAMLGRKADAMAGRLPLLQDGDMITLNALTGELVGRPVG